MLDSNARSHIFESGITNATSKRNPFELLASIFTKKKSTDDVDQEGNSDCGPGNDEEPFLPEADSSVASSISSHRSQGIFKRSDIPNKDIMSLGSSTLCSSPSKRTSVKDDLEALHLSRQDNPYLQHLEKLSIKEDRPPSLHFQSINCKDFFHQDNQCESPELHQHLIRSPPPQFPQNISHFMYSRANSPRHQNKDSSSSSLPETLDQSSKNVKKAKLLNPIQSKSDMDVLDPRIRKVLEYQKSQLFTGLQRSVSNNQIDFSGSASPGYVPATPTSLREIHSNSQSRWIHPKGARPLPKCQSSANANIGSVGAVNSCYIELYNSEEQTSKKAPLGPIKVGRTCSGP